MPPITKFLTTITLILALLSASCTDRDCSSVDGPTTVATATLSTTATAVPTSEAHWYDGKPDFEGGNSRDFILFVIPPSNKEERGVHSKYCDSMRRRKCKI